MSRLARAGEVDDSPAVASMVAAARSIEGFGVDIPPTLAWCVEVGHGAPAIGEGDTLGLWELLAATAAYDVSAARMLEPHLDALGILRQAVTGIERSNPVRDPRVEAGPEATWGVFAAESPDMRLEARRRGDDWTVTGTKPWCSLAAHLTHALVTATRDDGKRGLFAVNLRQSGVSPHAGPWYARGLTDIVSAPVDFTDVPVVPVGEADWYLTRPGFAWGGMSVAACWWGGAAGVTAPLLDAARSERADQLSLVHLGRVDAALWAARAALVEAADVIDAHRSAVVGDRLLAERVRSAVVGAATLALTEADDALGPSPLVADAAHARRVADLHLYLRQHHGARDLARIGRDLAATPESTW